MYNVILSSLFLVQGNCRSKTETARKLPVCHTLSENASKISARPVLIAWGTLIIDFKRSFYV